MQSASLKPFFFFDIFSCDKNHIVIYVFEYEIGLFSKRLNKRKKISFSIHTNEKSKVFPFLFLFHFPYNKKIWAKRCANGWLQMRCELHFTDLHNLLEISGRLLNSSNLAFSLAYSYEGCLKSLAQLLVKTKKFIFNENLRYNPSV